MPTVPQTTGEQWAAQQRQNNPTPEQILMTAADMKARGQLYTHPTDYSDPKAPLKLPSPGGGKQSRIGQGSRHVKKGASWRR